MNWPEKTQQFYIISLLSSSVTEQEYAANILRIVRDGLDGLIHTMFVADTGSTLLNI